MPRRPVRRSFAPRAPAHAELRAAWAPLAGAAGEETGAADASPSLALSARTAAEAAHGALRDALLDLRHPSALAAVEPDRWADEDGPLGHLYAGPHRLSLAERDAWEDRTFAHDRMHAAAGAYARALRREGVGLPAALAAVHATVAEHAALLPPAHARAAARDAARCCLEAYYAH